MSSRNVTVVLLIIFSVLKILIGIHCSKLSIRVQGGTQAASQEFPFLVSIQYQDSSSSTPQHICGGSVIASKYILTAAHCNFEDSGAVTNPSKLTIVYGTNSLSACPSRVGTYSACQRVQVKSITNHEKYDGNNVVNDIALYELASDLSLPISNIAMIPMNNAAVGTPHYIIGWGLTNDNVGTASNYLIKGLAPLVDDKFCNALGLDMSQSKGQLCAGSGNGIDACSGDSGGGLAMQVQISSPTNANASSASNATTGSNSKLWVVSGLVSYGPEGCGISSSYNNRGVYTSVAYFKNWIASKVSSDLIYYTGNGVVIDGNGGGATATNASTSTKHTVSNIGSQLTFHLFLGLLLFLFAL